MTCPFVVGECIFPLLIQCWTFLSGFILESDIEGTDNDDDGGGGGAVGPGILQVVIVVVVVVVVVIDGCDSNGMDIRRSVDVLAWLLYGSIGFLDAFSIISSS